MNRIFSVKLRGRLQARRMVFLAGAAVFAQSALFGGIIGEAFTPIGFGAVQACAGLGNGDGRDPGEAWTGTASTVCNNATGVVASQSAFSSGSQAGDPTSFSDSASGTATVGQLHLYGSHVGDTNYAFPQAYVNAGWNDTVTTSSPSLVAGVAGVWILPIQVSGIFTASGPNATSQASVDVFLNGNTLGGGSPQAWSQFLGLNPQNAPCTISSGNEQATWIAASGNGNPCVNVNVNTTLWFALPITIGVQYQLGIWAQIIAGEGAAGGNFPSPADTAGADMSHSILWGGAGYFIDTHGTVYNDISVTSGSGYNYNLAAVDSVATPEVSTLFLVLSGMAVVLPVSRRRRNASPAV